MTTEPAAPAVRTRWWLRTWGVLVGLLVIVNAIYQRSLWTMRDFTVYRSAGVDLVHGMSLYSPKPGLPFTYPPFSAVLFAPLDWVGVRHGETAVFLVSLCCYGGFVTVCAARSGLSWRATVLVLMAGLAFEPVLHTFGLGQVNMLIGLLVVLDCLVINDRRRGFLVGVAIGIKLTPLVFLLYFLLRRDWQAVLRAAVGTGFTIAVGWAVDPDDSSRFWTKLFYQPSHVGRVAYPYNQSVFGLLARSAHTTAPPLWLYGLLALGVVALAAFAGRRQLAAQRDVAALTSLAIAGLLISPISWTHHWIWLLPAGWLLVRAGRLMAAALIVGVAVIAPLRYIPTPTSLAQLHLSWWQTCLSWSYTAAGVVFLIVMCLPIRKHAGPRRPISWRFLHPAATESSSSFPSVPSERGGSHRIYPGVA